jgi:type II secretory pathway pseudopilin PulG
MMHGPRPAISFSARVRRARQGGFNFAEVLFAVMILGIGFIMTAAIFPVALTQTKSTQEETAAAGIARGAANALEQIATGATLPATGTMAKGPKVPPTPGVRCTVAALDQNTFIRGGMILSSDSRYAWVPFYRRDSSWPYAQVYMIPVAARNRSNFDMGAPSVVKAGVAPALVANIFDEKDAGNAAQVDYIEFPSGAGANDTNDNYTTVGPGAYVIIASAPLAPDASTVYDPTGAHARVGHIFRVGNPTETQPAGTTYPRRWELVPGNDYVPLPVDTNEDGDLADAVDVTEVEARSLAGLSVFVVGRELADPSVPWNATTNARDGQGQDIAAYTTFVNIR